jgi:hypothetical protein
VAVLAVAQRRPRPAAARRPRVPAAERNFG